MVASFDAWTKRFAGHVGARGKVPPGEHRAFGYEAPSHRVADWKLKWRELRMSAGLGPRGSSPAVQEQLGLNRDATFSPKSGEGEKLRRDT